MDTIIASLTAQSSFISASNRLIVIQNNNWGKQEYSRLVSAMAIHGPAMVLAGSDWVPGYTMVREIRRQTKNVKQVLERLDLARAFTCYQLLDLLTNQSENAKPLLVMDFLHNFYDSDIPMDVRMRTYKKCVEKLQASAKTRPVAVIVRFSPALVYRQFMAVLSIAADVVYDAISTEKPGIQPFLMLGG
jgi:hypothetical protein